MGPAVLVGHSQQVCSCVCGQVEVNCVCVCVSDGIYHYMKKQTGPDSLHLETDKHLQTFIDNYDASVIGAACPPALIVYAMLGCEATPCDLCMCACVSQVCFRVPEAHVCPSSSKLQPC